MTGFDGGDTWVVCFATVASRQTSAEGGSANPSRAPDLPRLWRGLLHPSSVPVVPAVLRGAFTGRALPKIEQP